MSDTQQCSKCAGVKGYDFGDGRRHVVVGHSSIFGVQLAPCNECGGTGKAQPQTEAQGDD